LNHISAKYPDPATTEEAEERARLTNVVEEIRWTAVEAFGSGNVTVAYDFLSVEIPKKTA
jgi:hypothetical protein